MILETNLSVVRGICSIKTLNKIKNIYIKNKLDFAYRKHSQKETINKLLPFLKMIKKIMMKK